MPRHASHTTPLRYFRWLVHAVFGHFFFRVTFDAGDTMPLRHAARQRLTLATR